jgi:CubicO group peptidase (beta-lactamase class C family)
MKQKIQLLNEEFSQLAGSTGISASSSLGKVRLFFLAMLMLYPYFYGNSFGQLKTLSGQDLSIGELDSVIGRQMDSLHMPGLSFTLINDGRVVYHRILGVAAIRAGLDPKVQEQNVNKASIFEAASLSKPVFAYLVLRLVDQDVLDLDTPLYRYLPYADIAADSRYKLITARMVLSHTTGLPNWRNFDPNDQSQHKYGALYLQFTPGTSFSYSGEGYRYLAHVIAHLCGPTAPILESLFQNEVAIPLGMQQAWFTGNAYISKHKVKGHFDGKVTGKKWPAEFPKEDSTSFSAAGGLHTEAISFSNFLIALMNGTGLSASSLEAFFKEQVRIPEDSPHFKFNGDTGWGLGIAIKPVSYGVLHEHGGNNGDFQSGFKINRANRNGYVFFTNCEQGRSFNEKIAVVLNR